MPIELANRLGPNMMGLGAEGAVAGAVCSDCSGLATNGFSLDFWARISMST